MRMLKIAGIAVGSVMALFALLLLAVWLLVDPNDYKDRISAAVERSTGRTLALPGDLKLSLFPWVKIETGEASLGNPPGFGDEPFLTLQRARLGVKVMPLLRSRLEIARIEIEGLDLRLQQDANGKGNWEEWGSSDAAPADAQAGGGQQVIDLAGVTISGRVAFEDMVAEALHVEIGRIAAGAAVPMSLQMQLVTAPGASPLPLAVGFRVTPDLDRQRHHFEELVLQGSVRPDDAPAAVAWRFAAPAVQLDLAAQTLAEVPFTAAFGAAQLAGSVAGTQLIDAPALEGRFELAELAPRVLMQQLGIASPGTRDPAVLARFAAQGTYAWRDGVAQFTGLKLLLDDSSLEGRFAWDTADSGMDFALDLDRIDLDRYQPPPVDPGAATESFELPVELLQSLRASGTFNVGEIRVAGMQLTQLSAGIRIADDVARLAPLRASLYGGQYAGDIGIDVRGEPRVTLDEQLTGIDMARWMKDFADSERLSGKGNLTLKLAGTGRNGDALMRTLNGRVALDLQNGAFEGADIWYAIAQAQSLLKNRQLVETTNQKRTAFETFKASADVADGVATTRDLAIASQLLRISGSGSTNLVASTLDYNLMATVLRTPPGADADEATTELVRAAIPVRVTGTLDNPSVRPDLAGLVRERVRQEIEERRDEVEQRVRDEVRDRLRGLFR